MDLDDINIVGVLFAVVGAIIGIIIAKKMGNALVARLLVGAVVGIICYFVGSKIASD